MKLSISNIGWAAELDTQVYDLMVRYGFSGLEIAPTRILPEAPYDRLDDLEKWFAGIRERYGFQIPSMQSIWYGRQEKLFGSDAERDVLTAYTKKAIDFAAAIGCKNLVFGCPRNRQLPEGGDPGKALPFFRELGAYAAGKGTVLAMEANPPLYDTNYINDTPSALTLIDQVASNGFRLNLDVGTMICNREQVSDLRGHVKDINHVHISEPGLKNIQKTDRDLHRQLISLLKNEGYEGFVSIEIGRQEDLSAIEETMCYVRDLSHDL